MSNSQNNVLVSVIGPDCVGFVSSIAGRLFDLGCNLGDTTFVVLGDSAEFTATCVLLEEISIEHLKTELHSLPELSSAEVVIKPFELNISHPTSESITHQITISGGDSPGLLARLCEVFQQFDANIIRLNTEFISDGGHGQFIIRASVAIPDEKADSCLAHIANTAGELGLKHEWEIVSP